MLFLEFSLGVEVVPNVLHSFAFLSFWWRHWSFRFLERQLLLCNMTLLSNKFLPTTKHQPSFNCLLTLCNKKQIYIMLKSIKHIVLLEFDGHNFPTFYCNCRTERIQLSNAVSSWQFLLLIASVSLLLIYIKRVFWW